MRIELVLTTVIPMRNGGRKNKQKNKIVLDKMHHICLAVDNVEKTAEAFSTMFGIGPFQIRIYESPSTKATVHGKPQGYRLKFGSAKVGEVEIELVQTLEGRAAIDDFLKSRGEGIHHLAFERKTLLEDELVEWKRLGIEAIQVDRNLSEDPRYGWAYMDTEKLLGCIIEIMCLPPKKE